MATLCHWPPRAVSPCPPLHLCSAKPPQTGGSLCGNAPAARMYCAPFPGWLSRLQISVPIGRAPSGYASPSLADTGRQKLTSWARSSRRALGKTGTAAPGPGVHLPSCQSEASS